MKFWNTVGIVVIFSCEYGSYKLFPCGLEYWVSGVEWSGVLTGATVLITRFSSDCLCTQGSSAEPGPSSGLCVFSSVHYCISDLRWKWLDFKATLLSCFAIAHTKFDQHVVSKVHGFDMTWFSHYYQLCHALRRKNRICMCNSFFVRVKRWGNSGCNRNCLQAIQLLSWPYARQRVCDNVTGQH